MQLRYKEITTVFITDKMNVVITLALFVAGSISATSGQLCLSESNSARANNGGLQQFNYNAQLEAAAKEHNDYMVSQQCFAHECPNEHSLGQRITDAGYNWSIHAENLAAGSSNCAGSVDQWINSDGHRANILGNYQDIGCAMANCNCNFGTYWTCVYANPI